MSKHFSKEGHVDGLIMEVGQTKVDRQQVGERKPLQCRSGCDGKVTVNEDGTLRVISFGRYWFFCESLAFSCFAPTTSAMPAERRR